MDDNVIRAMARWPKVPAVYGWLSLDRRGVWRLRGDPVMHRGAVEFINRNYAANAAGQWYFQNGPQRAFVDLEYTPWVYVLDGDHRLTTHTRLAVASVQGAWMDEQGHLLLATEHGVGLVCDRDLERVSESLERADGSACDEADIESVLAGDGAALYLAMPFAWQADSRSAGGKRRVPVGAVRRRQVAQRFGFDARPRAPHGDES